MTVSRRPAAADVEALINKGGQVPQRRLDEEETAAVRRLQLRLEPSLIAKIDDARKRRNVKPSRHMWLLEAVHDKLAKEQQ